MTQTRLGQRRDGFILIVVLGVVLVLCALLFGFSQTTRTSLAKADSFYRTEQAWNAAWGGLQVAVAMIRDVNAVCTDPPSAKLTTSENTFTIGDVNCTVAVTEENGLLNVNRLKGADGQFDRRHVEQFLRLIDVVNRQQKDLPLIGYGIVPAVIDWVDGDDEITCLPFVQRDNTGAENDDYQMGTPPRSCRNGPVDSLDELLWVRGMTPEGFGRLRPYLTCVGDGKIDINAAPKAVLQSLSEQIDAALAEMIVRQRKLKPFKSLAELGGIPGMTDNICRDIQSLITAGLAERFYRVRSQGNTQDHRCTMEAELRRNTQAGTVDILQYREL
jgi:general secretion pathway protein K